MLARAETSNRESPYGYSQSNNDYEEWARMAWTKPQFKRGDVDRAGEFLVNEDDIARAYGEDVDSYVNEADRAYGIINNWRSSHSYPLQVVKMTLLTRAKRVDAQAIVAQRIKRLSSIEAKLKLNKDMKLSQMQDLGGCRAILGTPRRVADVVTLYEKNIAKNPYDRPKFVKKYDYISQPKTSGYRSIHFVYKYQTSATELKIYDGLRIEIQLRSRQQHAWATAVETVSTFTGQALKSSVDPPPAAGPDGCPAGRCERIAAPIGRRLGPERERRIINAATSLPDSAGPMSDSLRRNSLLRSLSERLAMSSRQRSAAVAGWQGRRPQSTRSVSA
jgi:hypothetical protein